MNLIVGRSMSPVASSARPAALPAPAWSHERIETRWGLEQGLQTLVSWSDQTLGLAQVAVIGGGATLWSTEGTVQGWATLRAVLTGFAAGMAGVAGGEQVGIAFRQASPDGLPALRFERVGEEVDTVGVGRRHRWRYREAMLAIREAGDEIAAQLCLAGADGETVMAWMLRRPSAV